MKTMYFLESETRQKINDFHREKAQERLRETANTNHLNLSLVRILWKAVNRLAHLPQRVLSPAQHGREQVVNLERSLDEA